MDTEEIMKDYNQDVDGIFRMAHELNKRKKSNDIVGEKFDNGFTIDPAMARAIIRTYAPEKEEIYADSFTIDTIKQDTMLIARIKDGTVVYTVPLPKDTTQYIESMDFEKTLEVMKDTSEQYKTVRVLGNIGLLIAGLIAVGVYYFAYVLSTL